MSENDKTVLLWKQFGNKEIKGYYVAYLVDTTEMVKNLKMLRKLQI